MIRILGHEAMRDVNKKTLLTNLILIVNYHCPTALAAVLATESIPNRLVLVFDDLVSNEEPDDFDCMKPPERHHIEEALAFAEGKYDLVVSCNAGVSRSAATAYIIAAKRMGAKEALSILDPKVHYPNPLIVEYGADILGKQEINKIVQNWKDNIEVQDEWLL